MFSIPEEKLPEFIKNESRRNVLYAPLRSKTANPNDWNSKLISWTELIYLYCSCNNVYSFTKETLKNGFRHDGRTPHCLDEVLLHLSLNGEIQPVEIFLQQKPKSWKEWVTNTLISSPVSWSFNKLKDIMYTPDNNITYVPLKVIEKDGDLLLSKMHMNYNNKVISLKEILNIENKDVDKAKDFKILLTSLYKRGKIDIKEINMKNDNDLDNLLIKFGDGNECKPITEVDLGIRNLEQKEKFIEKNIEILEDNIIECTTEAKTHLVKQHRQLAKASLRKKHEIENRVDKNLKALYNVQTLLNKLQDSKMDEGIWESYKKAVSAFETSRKKDGINTDSVEDTMLQLGEVMEIQADVQNALSRPIIDEDVDLEKELEDLLNDDDTKGNINKGSPQKDLDGKFIAELEKLELNLPDVPSSPVRSKISSQIN